MTFLETVSLIRPVGLAVGVIGLLVVLWLLARRGSGEPRARLGTRLALYAPFAVFVLLFLGLIVLRADAEAAMGTAFTYWLFIGIAQGAYMMPAIAVALLQKRTELIWGFVRGAAIVAVVNALAWCVGLLLARL